MFVMHLNTCFKFIYFFNVWIYWINNVFFLKKNVNLWINEVNLKYVSNESGRPSIFWYDTMMWYAKIRYMILVIIVIYFCAFRLSSPTYFTSWMESFVPIIYYFVRERIPLYSIFLRAIFQRFKLKNKKY